MVYRPLRSIKDSVGDRGVVGEWWRYSLLVVRGKLRGKSWVFVNSKQKLEQLKQEFFSIFLILKEH